MSTKPEQERGVPACSARLARAARRAASAASKAIAANAEWARLFEQEYGHSDISDALVDVIDYSSGNLSCLTREFIAANSKPGQS